MDEMNFAIVHNYPVERRYLIKKPLKKPLVQSLKELLLGSRRKSSAR